MNDVAARKHEPPMPPPGPWWRIFLRRPMHFVLDVAVLAVAFSLAYLFRFDFAVPRGWADRAVHQVAFVVGFQLFALFAAGIYSYIWRYVGLAEVAGFARATLYALVPLVLSRFVLPSSLDAYRMPLSVILMDAVIGFGGVLSLRVVRRAIYEQFERQAGRAAKNQKPVLLLGAGKAGVLAARELVGRADSDMLIKGFVDDDREKLGSVIHGVKVLGTTADLPRLVRELGVDHVVITIAKAGREDFRRILDICESIPVKTRVIPAIHELLAGTVSVSRIRNVEIEDLLGREPIELDRELVGAFLTGKTVVVTGAGGSIGSELARQVARFGPRRLLLVERAEGALFDIDRELGAKHPGLQIVPVIADVGDRERVDLCFKEHRPDVVFHAAAHKHVPMMEKNPGEAIKNNVVGTRTVAEAAGRHGCRAFVLISTDKAVNPTSIMGASKRVAELVVQSLDQRFPATRFLAVRFGNVLGSAGSVIPIFREQILKGGPVTVTHPDMVRFFMTIPEAAQLVMQAGALGEGGEVFVLDMGEPVKIVELAKDMIRLSGLRPFADVDIVFSGVRPGEKLYEELGTDGEDVKKTGHPKIFIGRIVGVEAAALEPAVDALLAAAIGNDAEAVRNGLAALIPESLLLAPPPTPVVTSSSSSGLAAATA
ncbi:MAG: nucleoside-diphosphate sugar epimerase/dehydratase [Deltaproteobacteria bacterium]|nr:nucleoside-diphosphate sugar epimerase/dehydratase [Deltaproteobacteria bacterium]